jgi:hypothetical protein
MRPLARHELPIAAAKDFARMLKPIRDSVLAHSDPRYALNPDALYVKAQITFQEMSAIIDSLSKALTDYYTRHIGEPPIGLDKVYSGGDIDEIHAAYMEMRRLTDDTADPTPDGPND